MRLRKSLLPVIDHELLYPFTFHKDTTFFPIQYLHGIAVAIVIIVIFSSFCAALIVLFSRMAART